MFTLSEGKKKNLQIAWMILAMASVSIALFTVTSFADTSTISSYSSGIAQTVYDTAREAVQPWTIPVALIGAGLWFFCTQTIKTVGKTMCIGGIVSTILFSDTAQNLISNIIGTMSNGSST